MQHAIPPASDESRAAGPPPGAADPSAPRRTLLAAERTSLAWLRTGLGALGLALAVGRLLPALIDASHVAFGLLGAAYGFLGILLLVLSVYRARRVGAALEAGAALPADEWVLWLVTGVSVALGVVTVVLVLVVV
jgi:putative membrane protein